MCAELNGPEQFQSTGVPIPLPHLAGLQVLVARQVSSLLVLRILAARRLEIVFFLDAEVHRRPSHVRPRHAL